MFVMLFRRHRRIVFFGTESSYHALTDFSLYTQCISILAPKLASGTCVQRDGPIHQPRSIHFSAKVALKSAHSSSTITGPLRRHILL
ncbi:hypothetical protein PILCRDRAFT_684899 [Piloderma croceum F 1598]|uniref:Uncharacterized protein n=1 Tax=Piloderma croceum (strain F 1598) TaxID=765440 RepID=A0A0C3F558_PILCF|nr:hypothetical protein PILCRDRAFT_684899 [Piloderma croceum F 1598]